MARKSFSPRIPVPPTLFSARRLLASREPQPSLFRKCLSLEQPNRPSVPPVASGHMTAELGAPFLQAKTFLDTCATCVLSRKGKQSMQDVTKHARKAVIWGKENACSGSSESHEGFAGRRQKQNQWRSHSPNLNGRPTEIPRHPQLGRDSE